MNTYPASGLQRSGLGLRGVRKPGRSRFPYIQQDVGGDRRDHRYFISFTRLIVM